MNPQASVITPVPGDPEEARRISALFATVEGRAQEIASRLRSIESGIGPQVWAGQAADGFTALLAETGPDLTTLAASYGRASQALATYATELAAAQDAARAAQAEATTATEARDRAATDQAAARSDADRHAAEAVDAQTRLDAVGAQAAEQRRNDAVGRENAARGAVDQADQALSAARQKADEATSRRDAAAARCIRALEDASSARIDIRNLAQPATAAGPPQIMTIATASAATPLDPALSIAKADAELLRAGVADPKVADEMVDRATARLQEIAAQVEAGRPMTAQQQEYIRQFTEAAGPGALSALAVLIPFGSKDGARRARAAVATSLSAFTDPNLRAITDDTPLPDALRITARRPVRPAVRTSVHGAVPGTGRQRGPVRGHDPVAGGIRGAGGLRLRGGRCQAGLGDLAGGGRTAQRRTAVQLRPGSRGAGVDRGGRTQRRGRDDRGVAQPRRCPSAGEGP
jgi:uncharacterized protein YukE